MEITNYQSPTFGIGMSVEVFEVHFLYRFSIASVIAKTKPVLIEFFELNCLKSSELNKGRDQT